MQAIKTNRQKKIMQKIEKLQTELKKIEMQQQEMQNRKMRNRKTIPVFFAADDNYLPYLSVALRSLKENADRTHAYAIYVLHAGVDNAAYEAQILTFAEPDFTVSFVDVGEKLKEIKRALQLRDYYTGATYYRIFIAGMFPNLDKAIYLDSDIIVRGDISRLFNVSLGNNLVAAVPDTVVASVKEFRRYTQEVLGIEYSRYFNAGVLVMNLKKFREDNFYDRFCALLREYKFSVAQDQDYLNVLCKDKVKLLPKTWNTMPIGGDKNKTPMLVHYNLTAKPWHYADIPYAELFWRYAKNDPFYATLRQQLYTYGKSCRDKDATTEKGLIALAIRECEREDNYLKVRQKAEKLYAEYCAEQQTEILEEEQELQPVGV